MISTLYCFISITKITPGLNFSAQNFDTGVDWYKTGPAIVLRPTPIQTGPITRPRPFSLSKTNSLRAEFKKRVAAAAAATSKQEPKRQRSSKKTQKTQKTTMSHFWKPGTEKPRIVDDEEGGVLFLSTAASSSSSSGFGYGSMEKQRQRLPVYKYRTAILYLVETHATSIIVGETGSGKTTQIPQVHFLFFPFAFFFYSNSEFNMLMVIFWWEIGSTLKKQVGLMVGVL